MKFEEREVLEDIREDFLVVLEDFMETLEQGHFYRDESAALESMLKELQELRHEVKSRTVQGDYDDDM